MKRSWKKIIRIGLIGLFILFVLIQLYPYGRDHTNPPVTGEPTWDSPETVALFNRACKDCHSNRTTWPWYSNIAPASWLVQKDVDQGRKRFNVTEWGRESRNNGEEAANQVRKEAMPYPPYLILHPEAKLTPEEKARLIKGLEATFGSDEE